MQKLKDNLPILKLGTSKMYPEYGNYIYSDGKSVRTCNGLVYVYLDIEAPFDGSVNFYILEDILKKFEDLNCKQERDVLNLKSGNLNTNLNIATHIQVPFFEKPQIEMKQIDESLLRNLKLASKFVGSEKYKNVFYGDNCICATDTRKIFMKEIQQKEILSIDRKLISFLKEGMSFGYKDNNIIIEIENGFVAFATQLLIDYPIDNIKKFVHESCQDLKLLCNLAVLKEEIEKLRPIFFGELVHKVNLKNKDEKITLHAASALQGEMSIVTKSKLKDDYTMALDIDSFSGIPYEYDVYTAPTMPNGRKGLVLLNEDSKIVIAGL